jgi:formylmethanofuran dehydrogenase subunit E
MAHPARTMADNVPEPELLAQLLQASARRHRHLCPRQVLGVRLGLRGLRALGFVSAAGLPRFHNEEKQLLTIVETDGCGADGVAVATACAVGRRTLRVLDYGKVAATLVDTASGRTVRVHPSPQSRQLARRYAPGARSRWHAYLQAYQVIPDEALLVVQEVRLTQSLAAILSKPEARACCARCGEEILNEREVVQGDRVLCRHCAGDHYYELAR